MSEKYEELKKTFSYIYQKNSWGFGSGIGSLPDTTLEYRYFLEKFIAKNDITTIVDFGCGDWQFSRYIYWWDATYTGYDTVEIVIDKNNELYSTNKIKFLVAPKKFRDIKSSELLIVKDVFQHWSSNIILEFLQQVKGKFQYILITNSYDRDGNINRDISNGEVRPLNLLISPFSLPAEQIFSYHFHCASADGNTYSDSKNVLLLRRW